MWLSIFISQRILDQRTGFDGVFQAALKFPHTELEMLYAMGSGRLMLESIGEGSKDSSHSIVVAFK